MEPAEASVTVRAETTAAFEPEESGRMLPCPAGAHGGDLDGLSLNVEAAFPTFFRGAPKHAGERLAEFFAANINNANTRAAYLQAVVQFLEWCERHRLTLREMTPFRVAAYVEHMAKRPEEERPQSRRSPRGRAYITTHNRTALAAPSVKQHLAAIRMLFDWLVVGQVIPMNPASSVRGPKHVVKRGKTPVLTADEARLLLDSIDTSTVVGLRDRALIGTMVFSFARVSAVCGMKVEDFYHIGRRTWIRLHEKGGKFHEVPAHHNAADYVEAYIKEAGIADDAKGPLFRTTQGRTGKLTTNRITRVDVFRMIRRRALAAGLSDRVCCHTFRATGITAYLSNGGTIEKAQQIAAHESPRTTKLYDRTNDEMTLDEIERIRI
jgi:site-specific recombinase XerD